MATVPYGAESWPELTTKKEEKDIRQMDKDTMIRTSVRRSLNENWQTPYNDLLKDLGEDRMEV
eukprot:9247481-Prorocentrum_lima.AAC.1